jgi:hypothetical protein
LEIDGELTVIRLKNMSGFTSDDAPGGVLDE